ncbi:MAG: hypothetical protein LBC37_00565 [Zoogloeaceae bacterium]|jgi:hypothetical protein|nr:hypothetical protein [Zoogloeaceae bacterium]
MNDASLPLSATRDEKISYRFIPNEAARKMFFLHDNTGKAILKCLAFLCLVLLLVPSLLLLLALVIFPFYFSFARTLEFIAMLVVPLFLMAAGTILEKFGVLLFLSGIGLALLYVHCRKMAIVVEERGVTLHGFPFRSRGKFYEWREFAQIRRSTFQKRDVVVFVDCYGKSFLLHFGEEKAKRGFWSRIFSSRDARSSFFVGDGHALSLPEAIEKFHAPVTLLEEAERKKIPALCPCGDWNVDITGKIAHLILAAMVMVIPGVLFRLSGFSLLESWQSRLLPLAYCLAVAAGFAFSWRYLRELRAKESWEATWLVSLLFAASLWFLTASAAPLLPVWLGEARKEAFAVLEKEDAAQHQNDGRYPYSLYQSWRSTREPGVSFHYKIPEERRQYEPGAQQEFTVYHGPLGLRAMPQAELHSLWRKKKPDNPPE